MSLPQIERNTVTVEIYVGSTGRRIPVTDMADKHLLNALLVAESQKIEDVVKVLFEEVLRRMQE